MKPRGDWSWRDRSDPEARRTVSALGTVAVLVVLFVAAAWVAILLLTS